MIFKNENPIKNWVQGMEQGDQEPGLPGPPLARGVALCVQREGSAKPSPRPQSPDWAVTPEPPRFIVLFLGGQSCAVRRQLSFQAIKSPVFPSPKQQKGSKWEGGLGGGTQVIYDFNNPGSCKLASDSCSCQALEDKRPLNCGVCGPRWAPRTVYCPGKAVKAMR